MLVQVSKWGNSLGLRLPREIARRLRISEGQRVEMTADDEQITIRIGRPVFSLDELLRDMTPEAMHQAFDWGPDQGRERVE